MLLVVVYICHTSDEALWAWDQIFRTQEGLTWQGAWIFIGGIPVEADHDQKKGTKRDTIEK